METNEVFERTKERIIKRVALAVLAASLATPGTGLAQEGGGGRGELGSGLEKYGKILLYNANREEGGTMGYGGLVYDPTKRMFLFCTVAHVAEGGPIARGVFKIRRSSGEDPVLCLNIENPKIQDKLKNDVPIISEVPLEEGNEVFIASRDREPVAFFVVRTEYEKEDGPVVWLKPKNPDGWVPSVGDSGSLVARTEDGQIYAVGVYGGQKITPNPENPQRPNVEYYIIPFVYTKDES